MSSEQRYIVIAHFHSQPPFETTAEQWKEAKTFPPDTPLQEAYEWAARVPSFVRIEVLKESSRE